MKQVTGRELAGALERHGWILLRVRGSHHVYGRPGDAVRLTVPFHSGRPLKSGLLHFLLKSADLTEKDI